MSGPESDHRRRLSGADAELALLREENARLTAACAAAYGYIRGKTDELLDVIGTRGLRPEELDDQTLIGLDPIGIVATSFRHVLETLRGTNRRLKTAHDEIQAIFDTVGNALLVVDDERRIVAFNRQAERILLDHQGDVVGHCCSEILCGDDPAEEQCVFKQVMNGRREASLRGKQLRGRTFDVLAGPIMDDDGRVSLVVIAYHDTTEACRIERMKSEFVSTAAHELRTPLATIIGYADLLLNSPAQTQARLHEFLELIQNRAEHLAHIVSDLLDISRIEAGEGVGLICQPCRLDQICREVTVATEGTAGRHPVTLAAPAEGVTVQGDRHALTQILENLLSNAVKYSPAGSAIAIALRVDGAECELSVSDRGIGMTAEQVSHIFEKFYRVDSSNAAIPGTGLGMTIVKYLVDAHHGRISIDSTPGAGTSVRIRLPLVQPGDDRPA